MLELMKKELEEAGAFTDKTNIIVKLITDAMPSDTVPMRMKEVIAVSEIITYASQFRRNMWHWDGFELPINATSFIIADSGLGKDSSVKAARRCFAPGYELIENKRKQFAKEQAIKAASDAGEDAPYEFDNYKKYYYPPAPVLIAPTTPQGLIQHLNDISDLALGAGSIYAGEIGDELATNANMLEIIKTVAETYDTGDKEIIYTKGKEYRSKEVKSMALNSLFVGSPTYLLFDPAVRKKFLIAFGSKLARRANFCFVPKALPEKTLANSAALKEYRRKERDTALAARERMSKGIVTITEYHIKKKNELLQISEDVFDLFTCYHRYNYEVAKTINSKYPLSKLVRQHLQWKALKIAGAFAIFNQNESVSAEDYIDAINFCEKLNTDMREFESELVKEPYELFADFMDLEAGDTGKHEISIHDLKKLGYITGTGSPVAKMKELTFLASAYDKKAVYTYSDQSITYEKIVQTDAITISFIPVDNSPIFKVIKAKGDKAALTEAKNKVAQTANGQLTVTTTNFTDLALMLTKDLAYTPFVYKNNKRYKDTVISGTKVLVLDVDKSNITASEAHFILQDINHHIALSSDENNQFKFRVLIELDSYVDVNPIIWRYFFLSVGESLSLTVDPLAQSQLFFSYSGRSVLSVTDKSPLEVRDHLMLAHDKANTKTVELEKPLTTPQKQALLADELTTFAFAFECINNGGLNMIKAAHKAKHLGMPKDEIMNLMRRINNYWTYPMEEKDFKRTIISQIERW